MKTMKTMKKQTTNIIILFVLFLFLLTSCEKNDDVIKIGVITPLTGFTEESGHNVKKGLDLGKEYLEEKYDIEINLVYEDGECLGKSSINAYNKLKLDADIKIITGFVCSSEVLSIAPLLENDGILIIPVTASSPLITNSSNNIFRVGPNDKEDAFVHFNYINENYRKNESIGIVYINNDYGVAIKDALQKKLTENGFETNLESFNFGEDNYKTILSKLKAKKVKIISFIGYPENSLLFLKQIKELNYDVKILGSWATTSDEFYKQENKELLKNFLVTNFGEFKEEFENEYYKKYNEKPVVYSDFAFDSLLVIGELIKNENINSDTFKKININDGATGNISFDSNGDRIGLKTNLYKFEETNMICEYNC